MHLTRPFLAVRFLGLVALGFSIWGVGCGGPTETVAQKPIGEPAPGEFDQLELKINGKDALNGKMVLPVGKPFQVSGKFHFVKPFKRLSPFGSILVMLKWAEKGKRPGNRAGAASLKFIGNRRVTFSCDVGEPHKAGGYTLTVVGRGKIVMQTKVRVDE